MTAFRHRIEHAGLVSVRSVLARLSLDRGTAIAAAFGRSVSPALRKRALANLNLAMPELDAPQKSRIVTGLADHLARNAIEYLHLAKLRDDADRIVITGANHIEAARAAGRGAVLVTGHLGNWEAVRAACARLDWPPAIIYRRFNNPVIDDEAQRVMRAFNGPILHKGKRGTLGLLRHIRRGGAAVILCDQRFSGAPALPFFGIPAKTALAPAEIAMEYGAALLPVRGIRRGRTSLFDVTIDAPLEPTSSETAARDMMTEINRRLESWIRETPEQYFWLHNRWGNKRFGGQTDQ